MQEKKIKANKIIEITCGYQETISPTEVKDLQGELKDKTREQLDKLKRQILKHGFSFPLFVWRDKNKDVYAIDGHGRRFVSEELINEGYKFKYKDKKVVTDIPIVWIEAKSKREAKEKLLALNSSFGRISDEGFYGFLFEPGAELDFDEIKMDLDLPGLDLGKFEAGYIIDEVVEDEPPEPPKEAQSKLGDLYELPAKCGGVHRVLCGDSTKREDVERLMDGTKADMVFTDPPYGVEYTRHIPNKKFEQLENDDVLLFEWMENVDWSVPVYVCTRWDVYGEWAQEIKKYAEIRNVIVWDKDAYGLGDLKTMFAPSHEFIIYATKSPYTFPSTERDRDVWTVKRAKDYKHPTQKPVEIPERAIKHTIAYGTVLDLFLGSGSTLIASEKTERICYGCEIDPVYVDVTVQRYVNFTGNNKIKKNGKDIEWESA